MLENYPWLSILPPVLAILLAIITRQVFISLLLGIYAGNVILANGNPIAGAADTIELCINVFKNGDNTKVIIFSALIGALVAYTQRSGGVSGFINLISKKGIVKSRKSVEILTYLTGFPLFIESSITSLVRGTVFRPLFDKYKIPREKLAYICDSTSAPVCVLLPFNAWGAYILSLMNNLNVLNVINVLAFSLILNFYAIFTLIMVLFLIVTGIDFGPMKKAEERVIKEGKVLRDGAVPLMSDEVSQIDEKENIPKRALNMIIPIVSMIAMMFVGLLITGKGDITQGSGSTSVLWAVITAIVVGGILYRVQGIMNLQELTSLFLKGVGGLISLSILMMFAFAIGKVCQDMNTGAYTAQLTDRFVNPKFIPVLIFILTSFIAFATGTSWGTWGIMFPIGVGIAGTLDISLAPIVGAMLGGGVFGDHCSPISDTTIVASMASASDHIDHVNTQLPYALVAGSMASFLYIVIGLIFY
ncbi:Na+/H+ antiporter NhaC family protein [candidate division KSB1 bacterium]